MAAAKQSSGEGPSSPTHGIAVGRFLSYLEAKQRSFGDVVHAEGKEMLDLIAAAIPSDSESDCEDPRHPRERAGRQRRSVSARNRAARLRESVRTRWEWARSRADALRAPAVLVQAFARAPEPEPQPRPPEHSPEGALGLVSTYGTDSFEDAGRVLGWLQAVSGASLSAFARHGSVWRRRLSRAERAAGAGSVLTAAAITAESARIARAWHQGLLSANAAVALLAVGAARAAGGAAGARTGALAARRALSSARVRHPAAQLAAMLCGSVAGGAALAAAATAVADRLAAHFFTDDRAAGLRHAFRTLGLPPTATDDEVQSRFLRLASAAHPNKAGGSVEKFADLQAAYGTVRAVRAAPAARL
eukprot:TRINITY_DN36373_c0_g1_i1.p1 TRINITY_DN36373_c0_g1~~TRINITY_DN36373_c0_g1_i1.p1  ORF type:complete len:361 (+),score=101.32 TRINITY_DN36373_c0_g1_i1:151-1233(+)